jgi:hypothetical protein
MMPLAAAYSLLPSYEAERLQALYHCDVMPTQQEPIFDELVQLSAQVFNLPISLIALVDADEVAYKANQGLPGLLQQPREEAICAMVVTQRTPLVFTNLTKPDQLQRLTTRASAVLRWGSVEYTHSLLHWDAVRNRKSAT